MTKYYIIRLLIDPTPIAKQSANVFYPATINTRVSGGKPY
jgi:hypothetical protein